jgi:hypothetical protein
MTSLHRTNARPGVAKTNAMARGQLPALSVVALAGGPSRASSSVYAGSAMEAANIAAIFAAMQQKLNPIR